MPPTHEAIDAPVIAYNHSSSRLTCNASSRVGATTSARGLGALVARHHAFAHDLGSEIVENVLGGALQLAQTVAAVLVVFERTDLDRCLAVIIDVLGEHLPLDCLHRL